MSAFVGLALVLLIVAPASAAPAGAESENPLVIPPLGKVGHRTYDELSVSWWQHVLAAPKSSNPLLDLTGQGCANNQPPGPVFFLVGTAGSGAVTRDLCVVPEGRFLFFPLLNFVDLHTPGDELDTPELVWKDLQSLIGPTHSLFASVDGAPVRHLDPTSTRFRACAGPATISPCTASAFTVNLPADNIFGVAAGPYFPTVDDGVYLLLAPLPAGKHTLTFGGTSTYQDKPNSQNVTYHLTVAEDSDAIRQHREDPAST